MGVPSRTRTIAPCADVRVKVTDTWRSRPGSAASYVRLTPACLAIADTASATVALVNDTETSVSSDVPAADSTVSGTNAVGDGVCAAAGIDQTTAGSPTRRQRITAEQI